MSGIDPSPDTGPASSPPSEAVVLATAEQTGRSPLELPPLYETIDPDALDAAVQRSESCRVTFEYADCEVTVGGFDRVSVDRKRSYASNDD